MNHFEKEQQEYMLSKVRLKNAGTQKIWQRKSNHFLKKFKCYDKIHQQFPDPSQMAKIPSQFPGLEKNQFFPDLSLRRRHPEQIKCICTDMAVK